MHVHLRPIVFQPVPVARPVPRVPSSRVDSVKVEGVAGRSAGDREARQEPDRPRKAKPIRDRDAAPPRDPAAGLALTLATLALSGAWRD